MVGQLRQQPVGGAAASDVGVWRRWTLKAAAEVEMAAAADILFSSSSVIIVGSFRLASVDLYSRNSNERNMVIFPLSQGIYPASGGIYPKPREVSNK